MVGGDPYENRTRDSAVKGRCLNRLTNGPKVSARGAPKLGKNRFRDCRPSAAMRRRNSYGLWYLGSYCEERLRKHALVAACDNAFLYYITHSGFCQ